MKIVIAPDSFKGALRSTEVGAALSSGWRSAFPGDKIVVLPLADGGEGTCEAVTVAARGEFLMTQVHGPLMREITAAAGVIDDGRSGVMEMASASGIELLQSRGLDPMHATTFGTGELLKALLDRGVKKILIGIGGSATVDGGCGMLQALGAKFYDAAECELPAGLGGGELERIVRADLTGLDPRLKDVQLQVACDVTNPLLGERGAVAVFAPQKGATQEMLPVLERNLAHWEKIVGVPGDRPGDGAAGGLGYALRAVLAAAVGSGAQLVAQYAGFEPALDGAALVITGEGCSDEQTLDGKLCSFVALTAHRNHVPVLLVSGALRGSVGALQKCFDGVFSIAPGPCTLDDAIGGTAANLERTAASLARVFHAHDFKSNQ